MKEYILFLRGGDARMESMTEEQTAEHMQKWGVYMNNLAQNGHLVGGQPLQMDGRVLSNAGTQEAVVKSAEGESVGGWLHFKAENYDQACELAKDCPIFEHNGNIEIREVMPMDM